MPWRETCAKLRPGTICVVILTLALFGCSPMPDDEPEKLQDRWHFNRHARLSPEVQVPVGRSTQRHAWLPGESMLLDQMSMEEAGCGAVFLDARCNTAPV
ncbi:MAG TPA: hypothetical protein VFV38_12170 [Ktedonobacteraceae bacterium]|nr:hypothetical protein [Ktedonobacteraceae bacterium]